MHGRPSDSRAHHWKRALPRLKFSTAALLAFGVAAFAGCSGATSVSPASAQTRGAALASQDASPRLYVYSPNFATVATFDVPTSACRRLPSVVCTPNEIDEVSGAHTRIVYGFGGIAADDANRYVLVSGNMFGEGPSQAYLLTFLQSAKGDAVPDNLATLPAGSFSGIALDGRGNFWTADASTGELLRFPVNGTGTLSPSVRISPQLMTTNGFTRAVATTVALDANGRVYCMCVALVKGTSQKGVTTYAVDARLRVALVRSFYDLDLPDYPPQALHVDNATRTLYVAAPRGNNVIYSYPEDTPTGQTRSKRPIFGPSTRLDTIAALTTDSAGFLYVAGTAGVFVFSPTAHYDSPPVTILRYPAVLSWSSETYGDYIEIR